MEDSPAGNYAHFSMNIQKIDDKGLPSSSSFFRMIDGVVSSPVDDALPINFILLLNVS